MNLATIRAGLEAWLENLTGLRVYWRKRPQQWQSQAWIESRITSVVTIGRDSLTYRADEETGELFPGQHGLRSFTFEIQIFSHSFSDDKDSLHYSNIIRDALVRSSEYFYTINVGFGSILSTQQFDQTILRREVDMIQMDLLFHADGSSEDTTATTWIDTVEMEGDLDADGTIAGEFP